MSKVVGITRRDFLDGSRIALSGAALAPVSQLLGCDAFSRFDSPAPYPPGQTGMRGSHHGSWERVHALVGDGGFRGDSRDTGERYDLVVVGAGISGLAAAFFYRQARPSARILLLDNHDDFGGHAKRNEFRVGDTWRIAYGGTESIDTPSEYSPVAAGLLDALGIDLQKFQRAFHRDLYASMGMREAVFFDRETFGRDQMARRHERESWEAFAARTPLSARARADLVRLNRADVDYLPGVGPVQKRAYLEGISYDAFLRDHARVDPAVRSLYRRIWITYYGVGSDATPAYWAARDSWLPGLEGTLPREPGDEDPYIFHFPDGNASIARLLVRALLPAAVPGRSMEDVVTARVDYGRLDEESAPVRLRVSATALRVAQLQSVGAVEVVYASGSEGEASSVRAGQCVLACYNRVIPYLCPELPAAQKRGLAYAQKTPIVYANVLVRNWRPWVELGVQGIMAPGSPFTRVALDFPVSMGDYAFAKSPDEPVVLHLGFVPHHPEARGPEQFAAGRRELFETSFASYEAKIREQLQRMLAPGGFEHARDILGITVNRWPHGYAYEPNSLWDPPFASEAEKPWVIGRQRHGRVAVANSDAGASAMTESAIDQAHRAVSELLAADAGELAQMRAGDRGAG